MPQKVLMYYSINNYFLVACGCNPIGSRNETCNKDGVCSCNKNGHCLCKNNYKGKRCDSCEVGHYDLPSCTGIEIIKY